MKIQDIKIGMMVYYKSFNKVYKREVLAIKPNKKVSLQTAGKGLCKNVTIKVKNIWV